MHWIVYLVCYIGGMVVSINALFAKWRITELDYLQILLLGILFGIEPTLYFQMLMLCDSHFPCFGKYTHFLIFRLVLLIALRIFVHLIYLVIFNSFLVFNFSFQISDNNFFFPNSLLIFDVVTHYQLSTFKILKMV